MANYSCKTFPLRRTRYSHYTSVRDRRTDRSTDDNSCQ